MDLLPTAEQQQIVDSASSFLANEFAVDTLRQLPAGRSCLNGDQLRQLAELGWLGIGLPEQHGGVGYGLPEEALLFTELGKHLVSPAVLASVLAARLAARAGDEATLRSIVEGSCKVALATPRPGAGTAQAGEFEGELLLFEDTEAELALLATDTSATLFKMASLRPVSEDQCIDPTLSCGVFHASKKAVHCSVDSSEENLFQRGSLLVTALQLGIAEETLERSVAYAKEREQYGQAIGAFQAIKHYCADMSVRCEALRSMLYHASITSEDQHAAASFDIHTARALADDYAQINANTAVQIHGGMGYTQEMAIHLYVKRAQVLATLFGNRRHHLRKLLQEPAPKDDL